MTHAKSQRVTRGGKLVKLKRSCSVGSFLNEPKKNQETETRAAFTDACVHLKSSPEGLFEDERHLIQHAEPQPADRLPLYRWKLWRESYAPILGGLGVQKVRLERPSAKE